MRQRVIDMLQVILERNRQRIEAVIELFKTDL
jgi:hypothetical protein